MYMYDCGVLLIDITLASGDRLVVKDQELLGSDEATKGRGSDLTETGRGGVLTETGRVSVFTETDLLSPSSV